MASPKQKTTISANSFMGAAVKPSKPEDAFFHVLPVPYTGARFRGTAMAEAADAILLASQEIETWDGRSVPARHGIHTHPAVDCKGSAEKVMEKIAAAVAGIVKKNKFPIGIGGDGAITFGMIKGLLDAGVENFGVIHIDAQADLRDDDNGDAWSEACVMKRIVDEDVPLFQLGVRSLSKEEADARKVYGVKFYDADYLVSRNVNKVELPSEFPENVFLSIDIDGFDPSVFPTPGAIPGGLGWWQVLSIIESITQQTDIIGMDLTEYSPVSGQPFHDNAAALLIYKIMGMVERARL
jgi:agmatinase